MPISREDLKRANILIGDIERFHRQFYDLQKIEFGPYEGYCKIQLDRPKDGPMVFNIKTDLFGPNPSEREISLAEQLFETMIEAFIGIERDHASRIRAIGIEAEDLKFFRAELALHFVKNEELVPF